MKSLIYLLLFSILPTASIFSQPHVIRDFEERYDREDDVTVVTINGSMIQFAGWIASLSDEKDEDLESFRNLSKGVNRIHIIDFDHWNHIMDEQDINKLEKDLLRDSYEVIMNTRERDQSIKVLSAFGKRNELKDVVIFVQERNELSIICIDGSFRMSDIKELLDDDDYH